MKIAITGSNGQLGVDLLAVLGAKHDLYPFDIELDITDLKAFIAEMSDIKPEMIVHSAAFTDVDGCETRANEAFRVNAIGTQNVALAAKRCDAAVLYVSTDYIFDGTKGEPYNEFDLTNPLSVYGKSKLAGEFYCTSLLNDFYVVRTSWLYGKPGSNFVSKIIAKAKKREPLWIVNDQTGSPTFSYDLAQNIGRLIESERFGIYHLSGNGQCNWFDFARKIVGLINIDVDIVPITSDQLGAPAKRPHYSVLDNFCAKLTIGDEMPHWEESLKRYVEGRERGEAA